LGRFDPLPLPHLFYAYTSVGLIVALFEEASMDQGTDDSKPVEGPSVEALVQQYLPSVRKWAHGRLPRAARREFDTQDLVQEAALRLLRRGRRFELRHAFAVQAYMRQTVLNLARDQGRRLAHSEMVELPEELPCSDTGPLEFAISQERRAHYEKALSSLAPRDRGLLIARLEKGMKPSDIAYAFGFPSPDAARMAVLRAFRRLMHKLSK
jgi:RNA polymerase sigma-70 factor (ECF subfamily)